MRKQRIVFTGLAILVALCLGASVVFRYRSLRSTSTLAFEKPRQVATADELVPMKVIQPATRPAAPLPANATCITAACHAALRQAPHIHGPIANGNCFVCHAPDAGNHTYPLKLAGSQTCTFCHSVSGTMKHQHKALEKGCITCHQPHTSQVKFLLRFDSESKLCESCHTVTAKAFQHEPFGRGECSTCHAPHESNNTALLKVADGTEQCARCHESVVRTANAVTVRHTPATRDCSVCHSPHSSDFKHQLRASVDQLCSNCHPQIMERVAKAAFKHTPVTNDAECASCHNPHGANEPKMLLDRQDQLCLKCHDKAVLTTDGREIPDMRPVLRQSRFLHGPIRAGECSPCHDSHAADQKSLLRAEFPTGFYTAFALERYDLCFKCHEKDLVLTERTAHLTGFRDGDLNLHYLHVNRDPKGRSCRSCHAIHGSDSPNHIAQKVQFDGSAWALEMNYAPDRDGGSCQPGCHARRDYRRSKPIEQTIEPATQPTTQPTGGPS